MKKNILILVLLTISSFSFSQVSNAKKIEIVNETEEENKPIEVIDENVIPSTKQLPISTIIVQPIEEPKNAQPAISGRKKQ